MGGEEPSDRRTLLRRERREEIANGSQRSPARGGVGRELGPAGQRRSEESLDAEGHQDADSDRRRPRQRERGGPDPDEEDHSARTRPEQRVAALVVCAFVPSWGDPTRFCPRPTTVAVCTR